MASPDKEYMRVFAEIIVNSDTDDLPSLFRQFLVPFDECRKTGECGRSLIPSPSNWCSISSNLPESCPLADHLGALCQRIKPFAPLFKDWSDKYDVLVLLALYTSTNRLRINVDNEMIRVLAETGASVDLDMYSSCESYDPNNCEVGWTFKPGLTGSVEDTQEQRPQHSVKLTGDAKNYCLSKGTDFSDIENVGASSEDDPNATIMKDRSHVTISVFSDNDSFVDLYQQPDIRWDDTGKRGDYRIGGIASSVSWCSFFSKVAESKPLEVHFSALAERIKPFQEFVRTSSKRYPVVLEAVVFSDFRRPSIFLRKEDIQMLSDINASVHIDIFSSYEP